MQRGQVVFKAHMGIGGEISCPSRDNIELRRVSRFMRVEKHGKYVINSIQRRKPTQSDKCLTVEIFFN